MQGMECSHWEALGTDFVFRDFFDGKLAIYECIEEITLAEGQEITD